MRRALALINQNCRLAARLISDATDRRLTPLERAGLAIHLAGCRSCRRYRKQVHLLDQLIEQTAHPAESRLCLSRDARERIAEGLHG
jgi:predicted anti-sigma-YlaC factor YlaD